MNVFCNDAVPEAGAPMGDSNGVRNDAVPEAGAPMRLHWPFSGVGGTANTLVPRIGRA